jgi:predicted house-cleaning noncanonical NTP pyrophosphatase (MazG superfamily)
MQEYNKLVRDNIPHIMKEQGSTPHTKILSDDQYLL